MFVCFHRIPLLLYGFLTDWLDISCPMRFQRSRRPLRSLRSLDSWSLGPREDGEIRSSSSPDLREPRRSWRASDPSPEASLLVHRFRHLALQKRHADQVQLYSAPSRCHHCTQTTTSSMVPTWGQLKHITQQAKELTERGRHEATPMVCLWLCLLCWLVSQGLPVQKRFIGPICLIHLLFSLLIGWMSPFVFLLMILIFWVGLPSILIMLKQWSALPSIFQVCPFIYLFALPYLPPYKDQLRFWMDVLALPWKACLLILWEAMARETFGPYSC